MAAKKKQEVKTVRLTAPNGVTVEVDAAKEERLRGSGFTDAKESSKSTSADTGYGSLTVADLKAEIGRRNEGRDEDDLLPTDGKKSDLIATLEADDSASSE